MDIVDIHDGEQQSHWTVSNKILWILVNQLIPILLHIHSSKEQDDSKIADDSKSGQTTSTLTSISSSAFKPFSFQFNAHFVSRINV